jgi:hypothetical protein
LRLPSVDPVELEEDARLAVVVAVVLLANALDVAALKIFVLCVSSVGDDVNIF